LRTLPLYLLLGAVLAYWLLAKTQLFARLEYTSDLFSSLQMSLSLGPGRHLLQENGFGDHRALHNYYLLPLLYPLTRPFGAYGLFVGLALLTFAATIRTLRLAQDAANGILVHAVACVTLLLGPVAYWMWDHPVYGWHGELLFLPLAILFATSLIRGRGAWLAAAALILVREEGAILGWAIHTAFLALGGGSRNDAGEKRSSTLRSLFLTSLVWALIFAAGMGVLFAFQKHLGRSRLSFGGLANPFTDAPLRAAYFSSLCDAFAILGSGAIFFAGAASARALGCALLCSLPLLVPISIGAVTYGAAGLAWHGAAWPPRFVILWSLLAATMLFGIRNRRAPPAKLIALGLGLASIVAQLGCLWWRRHYQIVPRIAPALSTDFVSSRLSSAENELLWCLGRTLPVDTPVAATGSFFAPFHRQEIVWPDRIPAARRFPLVVVCDEGGRVPFEYGCRKLEQEVATRSYETVRMEGVSVSSDPRLTPVVQPCIHPRVDDSVQR